MNELHKLINSELLANQAIIKELTDALKVLVDHAQEKYPHFEQERGQEDIRKALDVIAKVERKV